jgi:HEAT repeat protein
MMIDSVLSQLGSANPWLQQIMRETIQDSTDPLLWQRLLGCLALQRWGEYADGQRRADHETAARMAAAITHLFVEDSEGAPSPRVRDVVLQESLTHTECRIRSTAAALLGLRGDARGLEVLLDTVRTGDPDCKLRAVNALGKLKDARGGTALVEALAGDDETLHWEASRALDEMGERALPALLEALKSSKPHVRWHVIRALAGITDRQAVAGVAEGLGDADYSVRWAAAEALAGIGLPAVIPILERLSHYAPMDDTYRAAYHALHHIGPAETQRRLQALLNALRGPAAPIEGPMVAYRLLQEWETGRTTGEQSTAPA